MPYQSPATVTSWKKSNLRQSVRKSVFRLSDLHASNVIPLFLSALLFGCGDSESRPAKTIQPNQAAQDSSAKTTPVPLEFAAKDEASDASQALAAAAELLAKGELESAFELMSQQLIRFPDDVASILLTSRIERARGNQQTAIELAESIPIKSAASVDATNVLVQLYLEANEPKLAIQRINRALNQGAMPGAQAVLWRQQLWALLNRLGRRQEASAHADVLCRAGYINRQLLISLLRRNDSFPIVLNSDSPSKHFYPGLGHARWSFSQGKYEQALEYLKEQKADFESSAARALYGRLLAETQANDEIPSWHDGCDEETRKFSDYWAAMGIFLFDQQELSASAFALCQAVSIDPTDDDLCHRLARVLAALDRRDDSLHMREHGILDAKLKNRLKQLSLNQPQPELTDDLPEMLLTLGRPFESIGWSLVDLPPGNDAKRQSLQQQREFLRSKVEAINMASEVAMTQIDRDDFSMDGAAEFLASSISQSQKVPPNAGLDRSSPSMIEPKLDDVAQERGLVFQWYHAKEIDLASIPLHEMLGGGICVCDFDRDGFPDVYFGQGSGDPPSGRSTRSNQLFRNRNGHFADVTVAAVAQDDSYSSGIAAGDVNQDGFPDLYLGALGGNRLLINNGDGTFRDSSDSLGEPSGQFTSSVAIADLTGNGLPDLFEGVYVEMDDAFRLPDRAADGKEVAPSPNEFYAEVDRWYANQGEEKFQARSIDRERIEPGTSLGIVITDIDADGSNDVLVSNDARPNHLLSGFGTPPIRNGAGPLGLAFGFRGFSNSCMGIASGDFNRDGRLDFHITNFQDEPNNYFLQSDAGVYGDFATRYGLGDLSESYLGFGIKAVDFNRDGWLDFFTTNGHVFDERFRGKEFQMPPQIFLNHANQFVAVSASDPERYCAKKVVGRSVAKIDFDRDLDVDLIVGHLDVPAALLDNSTTAQGNAVQLAFVGTDCERDAIGTRVVVTARGESFTDWVTAGNGFLCSDDPVIDLGIGSAAKVDSIEVYWAGGYSQTFRDIAANERYLVVEGQDEVWLDRTP
ncbi:FG-GAP-like repeat-containing protein [Stieleria marina]|uniref:ASPIC and UnbV n=1 Tax=Stieleria marina TaxID=1930275 RepID=A0A517NT58_9BACT|nr:ASPIC and UnbV [Planctomycetes bacterium K23_9]